jgi:putative transposase
MPKGKKHTPEQIIGILRRIDQGEAAVAVCRDVNISEATLYRWKQQYGALELDEFKELKALREENARLKRVVADQALNIQVLKEVNSKKW